MIARLLGLFRSELFAGLVGLICIIVMGGVYFIQRDRCFALRLEADRLAVRVASLETAAQAAANKAEVQMKYHQAPPIDPEKRDELSIKLER